MIGLSHDIDLGGDTTRMAGTSDAARQRTTTSELLQRLFHEEAERRWELQLVADEVGMGKTFVALAAAYSVLQAVRERRAPDDLAGCAPRALVIAPHRTLAQKWQREAAEFVRRCIAPHQQASAREWFKAAVADRADTLGQLLREDEGPALVITHMGVLSGAQKLNHYKLKRRVLLGCLFRVWGNRFSLTAREMLLKGAPDGWPGPAELAALSERETWAHVGFKNADDLVATLRRIEEEQEQRESDGPPGLMATLLERCRAIAEPYTRDRKALFAKVESDLNQLFRHVSLARGGPGLPLVIVDEAHHWRNGPRHNTNGYGAFQQYLAPRARRALLLTATPFQLRPAEVLELVKAGEAIAATPVTEQAEQRRARLRHHRENVVAPVLRQSATQSRLFAQAWGRVAPSLLPVLENLWSSAELEATRTGLSAMAAEGGSLKPEAVSRVVEAALVGVPVDARDLLREGLRLFAYNQDLSCELGALVIRHRRRTDHRACAVGSEYQPAIDHAIARSDRHLLHAAPGLEVSGEAELPHYLLMRCVSEMKQGRGRSALGSSLTGCYSTLLRSSEGRNLGDKLPKGSVGRRYFDLLQGMIQDGDDADHPKVSAVVESVLAAWRAGYKSLIFCFRTNTAHRLETIIDRRIGEELQKRLEGTLTGEEALTRLRRRFQRKDDDLVTLTLDRVLWSVRWAALWEQHPLALPELTAEHLTLRDGELEDLARLALRAQVDLREDRVDRVFVHRATEHVLAQRLARELSHPGATLKHLLAAMSQETWVSWPYGFDPDSLPRDNDEDDEPEGNKAEVAPDPDSREGIHGHYPLIDTVDDTAVQDLARHLVERRERARQQNQASVLDSYARAPSFWLGVDIEAHLEAPSGRLGQMLAAHHAHLLNLIRPAAPASPSPAAASAASAATAAAKPVGPPAFQWGERQRLQEALRRTVLTRSVMLRLMPERSDIEAQGWAEALVASYYELHPGQHESFAERLTVFVEDFQAASGSAWDPHSSRRSLFEASRLRWAATEDADQRRSGNVARVAGDTDQARRERVFAAFNSPLPPDVLVCTSVGQEGIDLHRHCRHVIHYDLAWNPAAIEQRTGRVDRIGSKTFRDRRIAAPSSPPPFLHVGVPFLAGTYDERMYEELRIRAQTFEVLTGGDVTIDPTEDEASDAPEGAESAETYPALPIAMINDLRVKLHVWEDFAPKKMGSL
jgi:Helicase conserved C-terminal domain